jgi:hypothetical protein
MFNHIIHISCPVAVTRRTNLKEANYHPAVSAALIQGGFGNTAALFVTSDVISQDLGSQNFTDITTVTNSMYPGSTQPLKMSTRILLGVKTVAA